MEAYQEKEIIIELYNAGKSHKEIGEKIGKARITVTKKIKKLKEEGKIKPRKSIGRPKKSNKEQEQKIIKLYNEGKSHKEIGEEIGKARVTVTEKIKSLKEEGKIKPRKSIGRTEKQSKDKEQEIKTNDNNAIENKYDLRDVNRNDIIKEYLRDVERIIYLLHNDRKKTYVDMQSTNLVTQRKAISRMDNIEILIDDLRNSIKNINSSDIRKKEESEQFLKRTCKKYRELEKRKKEIEEQRYM